MQCPDNGLNKVDALFQMRQKGREVLSFILCKGSNLKSMIVGIDDEVTPSSKTRSAEQSARSFLSSVLKNGSIRFDFLGHSTG